MTFKSRSSNVVLALATISLLFSCTPNSSEPSGTSREIPIITKVTKESYMNGRKFCETYSSITKNEYGKRIKVPYDYSNPLLGSMEVYAYTTSEFDANKPSVIFVDGGPGQNTHGIYRMTDYSFNEIHFDQRGLGCSAPDTWEIYKDATIYSSENNIRDMDEIRKAYGINKWSVYGVSYGTVPSTMYASKYANHTSSLIIEGVVGPSDLLHRWDYKVEKLNIVYNSLNQNQKNSFADMILNSNNSLFILKLGFQLFYTNKGMQTYLKFLNNAIDPQGNVNQSYLDAVAARLKASEHRYNLPQQPMAVDENILGIIYCKNLNARQKRSTSINFSRYSGFNEIQVTDHSDTECTELGVNKEDESPYVLESNKTSVPVYYFQGSHDGATMAKGALKHWQTVATGKSYFLLSKKGGHNPLISRISNPKNNNDISAFEKIISDYSMKLFSKAINVASIEQQDIQNMNFYLGNDSAWILFRENQKFSVENDFNKELEGIKFDNKNFADLIIEKRTN